MASPRVVIFPIFDATTKAPLTGQTPVFAFYADDSGNAQISPIITEIGGGFYKFTPALIPNQMTVYMLNCGPGADPQYLYDTIRAESFDEDLVGTILANTAAIPNVPYYVWEELIANHGTVGSFGDVLRVLALVLSGHVKIEPGLITVFAEDGTTIFQTQPLKNAAGDAGALDATERLPATRASLG